MDRNVITGLNSTAAPYSYPESTGRETSWVTEKQWKDWETWQAFRERENYKGTRGVWVIRTKAGGKVTVEKGSLLFLLSSLSLCSVCVPCWSVFAVCGTNLSLTWLWGSRPGSELLLTQVLHPTGRNRLFVIAFQNNTHMSISWIHFLQP